MRSLLSVLTLLLVSLLLIAFIAPGRRAGLRVGAGPVSMIGSRVRLLASPPNFPPSGERRRVGSLSSGPSVNHGQPAGTARARS